MRAAYRFLAVAITVAFLWGAFTIVMTPVETGDAYPRYSSLRADPLGTKLLFDSLQELPGVVVTRNFKPVPSIANPASTSLLMLGLSGPGWFSSSEERVKHWEQLASRGVRLVFVFEPAMPALDADFSVFQKKQPDSAKPAPLARPLQARWGVTVKLHKVPASKRAKLERLPRDSALYFEPDASWTVFDKGPDGSAVHIGKSLGSGTIVLASQGFRVSNEALREQSRRGEWLAGLIGPGRSTIVFDEFSHGIAETGSVGSLIRRYHLQGAVFLLILAGILFIWRNASSLLPARETQMAAATGGRDAGDGLTALLQRSVAAADLIPACWFEWRKDESIRPPVSTERLQRMEQAIASMPADRKPADAYRQLQNILTDET
jgi:hypothetical protein